MFSTNLGDFPAAMQQSVARALQKSLHGLRTPTVPLGARVTPLQTNQRQYRYQLTSFIPTRSSNFQLSTALLMPVTQLIEQYQLPKRDCIAKLSSCSCVLSRSKIQRQHGKCVPKSLWKTTAPLQQSHTLFEQLPCSPPGPLRSSLSVVQPETQVSVSVHL
jgi:hypothetical protein